jgi:hypothetical protein
MKRTIWPAVVLAIAILYVAVQPGGAETTHSTDGWTHTAVHTMVGPRRFVACAGDVCRVLLMAVGSATTDLSVQSVSATVTLTLDYRTTGANTASILVRADPDPASGGRFRPLSFGRQLHATRGRWVSSSLTFVALSMPAQGMRYTF